MSFEIKCNPETGLVQSVKVFGEEMLDQSNPHPAELFVNDLPLTTRLHRDPQMEMYGVPPLEHRSMVKGEIWNNFWAGSALVVTRHMQQQHNARFNAFGITHWIRRELGDVTQIPNHGPGGPMSEAPLWVDTFSLLNWNWKFWGDDTRMMFTSAHSAGPVGEWGHAGFEDDTPEAVKKNLISPWRRLYPGTMVIHGGMFYNARTEHWVSITCRRPHVGYMLNLDKAGRAVGFDFKLHAHFGLGDSLRMPDIVIHYGQSRQEMMEFLADYAFFHTGEAPEWVHRTQFRWGLAWDHEPTWTKQGDLWESQFDEGLFSGISYSLVTDRYIASGTEPISYQPNQNYGTTEEFKRMCRRLADKGVKLLIWMSHSGLCPGKHEIDDDWFVRGINGEKCASWGNRSSGMYYVNCGHPGYIEYVKKWISFYMKECGCKGIFFDCYGTGMPIDFRPRSFMRYPGDTPLMVIKFMDEIHRHVKSLDPEGIVMGEGAAMDGEVDIVSFNTNPRSEEKPMGPRDFILELAKYSPKRIAIDQGPMFHLGSGISKSQTHPELVEHNKYMTKLLAKRGCGDAVNLVGDLSILDDLLVVPWEGEGETQPKSFSLPKPWDGTKTLVEEITGAKVDAVKPGEFKDVGPGFYKMKK